MPVPRFKQYYGTVSDMDQAQKAFFQSWRDAWREHQPISVDGQISYLFCYIYEVLTQPPGLIIDELGRLEKAYPNERESIGFCCRQWSSDAYMVLGEYRKALEVRPEPKLERCGGILTDEILSIRLQLSERIRGRDVLTLIGPKTTKWGRAHLNEIVDFIEVAIRAEETNRNTNLLREWAARSRRHKFTVFTGSIHARDIDVPMYAFSRERFIIDFVRNIIREGENTAREEAGYPRVGEGWIAERTLYYELKAALVGHEVVHHAKPTWLSPQHLDVFVPSLAVGVEYQGLQHDQPVEYFGGEAAYRECKSRDDFKRSLCRDNGIRLIYARPGYDLKLLLADMLRK